MLDRALLFGKFLPALPSLVRHKPTGRMTVGDRVEAQAAARGSHPFVLFEERRVSYAETNTAANRVAHWALEQGFGKGDAIALLMENRPEFLATWMGLAKVGVTTALLNTNLEGKQLRHALSAAKALHVIVGSELLERWKTTAGDFDEPVEVFVAHDPAGSEDTELPEGAVDLNAELDKQTTTNPDASVRKSLRSGDDLFYIYTSGTTGLPKAARFSHMRFLQTGDFTAFAISLTPDDIEYCALPLYHTAGGVMLAGGVLSAGATIALRRKFSASAFWDDIRRSGATCFQYIGEFCRYLVNQPESVRDPSHRVRVAIGNGLRPDIWPVFQKRFGIDQIVEFYGATEGNTVLINLENKVGSIGRYPFDFMMNGSLVRFDVENEVHPRGADGLCLPCERGEAGELVAPIPRDPNAPAGRFEGYTSKEDSEKKILRDVFRKGDRCFRTGDLLRQDDEGFFYFVDRIGDTYRWKGENVSTQEVAEAVSSFPDLEIVNVYGVEVPGQDGRAGMAALLLGDASNFDGGAFYEHIAASGLPAYAAPLFARVLTDVEVTGTFKLRKVELQKEGFDLSAIADPVFVRDDASKRYVELTPEMVDAIRSGERRV